MQLKLLGLRKVSGDSQKVLANLIGISENSYRNKELGKTKFNSDEMFIIANYYNKTLDDIFLQQRYPYRIPKELKKQTNQESA